MVHVSISQDLKERVMMMDVVIEVREINKVPNKPEYRSADKVFKGPKFEISFSKF